MNDTRIALLRAVNLVKHNRIAMADLRELCIQLGFEDPRTLLQSGNLVFRCSRAAAELESVLEAAAKERLGLKTEFFVRDAAEWKSIVAGNPFPQEAQDDPSHLLVMFLRDAPSRGQVTSLQKAIVGREVVRALGRQAYIVYPDGVGRSRLTSNLIESKLGTRGTARNWNTVLKLSVLAE